MTTLQVVCGEMKKLYIVAISSYLCVHGRRGHVDPSPGGAANFPKTPPRETVDGRRERRVTTAVSATGGARKRGPLENARPRRPLRRRRRRTVAPVSFGLRASRICGGGGGGAVCGSHTVWTAHDRHKHHFHCPPAIK